MPGQRAVESMGTMEGQEQPAGRPLNERQETREEVLDWGAGQRGNEKP